MCQPGNDHPVISYLLCVTFETQENQTLALSGLGRGEAHDPAVTWESETVLWSRLERLGGESRQRELRKPRPGRVHGYEGNEANV